MVSVLSTQASRRTNLHRTANKIKQGSKSSHTLVSTASLYLFLKAELYILTVLTWGRRVPASALPTGARCPSRQYLIHVFVSQGIEP